MLTSALPFVLHTDWSVDGISAILGQRGHDGQRKLVACISFYVQSPAVPRGPPARDPPGALDRPGTGPTGHLTKSPKPQHHNHGRLLKPWIDSVACRQVRQRLLDCLHTGVDTH